MPTITGPAFAPGFSGYPAHMSSEDYPLWLRYYPTVKPKTVALYFDVGLGLPEQLPTTDDAASLLGWIRLNQKRADALIITADKTLLVELRFNAQANALGRLLLYRALLDQDNPWRQPVDSILVTNRFDHEIEMVAKDLNIQYVIV
jgi:hypothetical protein